MHRVRGNDPHLRSSAEPGLKTLEEAVAHTDQLELFSRVEERRQLDDSMRYWRKWLTGIEEHPIVFNRPSPILNQPPGMPHYRGAGILFIAATAPRGHQLLLGRRKSGVWSIPGGGSTRHDADAAATAWRETHEEFGHPQHPGQILFTQRYPFALLGFDWTTLVVELPAIPDPSIFPSPHARDFHREFTEARWFPIHQLPERTHLLIYPLLLRLRTRRFQSPFSLTSLPPITTFHLGKIAPFITDSPARIPFTSSLEKYDLKNVRLSPLDQPVHSHESYQNPVTSTQSNS